MAAWVAPAIGAVTSLFGGLFGESSKKKQAAKERAWHVEDRENEREYARGAYDRLVKDAAAAGFNPLTALRAGGAPGSTANSHPFLSSGGGSSPLGDAMQNVGNIIANFDPFEDKLREQEYQVQQAELQRLQLSNTAASKKMFDVPVASGRRTVSSGPTFALKPLPERFGQSMTPEVVAPEVVNPWPGSLGVNVNPNIPNAEQFEDRYGEFAGSAIGSIVTIGGDALLNYQRFGQYLDRQYGQYLPGWMRGDKRPRLRPK